MNDYIFKELAIPDAHIEVKPSNEFRFNKEDKEVLRLDERGFHYKGQTIDDAGKAYRLFMEWMNKAQESE